MMRSRRTSSSTSRKNSVISVTEDQGGSRRALHEWRPKGSLFTRSGARRVALPKPINSSRPSLYRKLSQSNEFIGKEYRNKSHGDETDHKKIIGNLLQSITHILAAPVSPDRCIRTHATYHKTNGI